MLIDYKKVDIYHKDGAPVLQNVNFHVDVEFFVRHRNNVVGNKLCVVVALGYCVVGEYLFGKIFVERFVKIVVAVHTALVGWF